ncbi:response regulator [Actinomadura sp. 9N215]|uniref:response regulator n=1 Tax=Actinomadura sp. 9N215 TaxID=3375150 RepID=UPI0037A0CAC6
MSIRVVVADDQELVRGGFAMILEAQPDISVVAQAGDGEEAVAAAGEHRPDVVLMDIRMPRLGGIEATRRVCAETESQVLILTTFDQDDYVFAALQAGASGFLLKDVRMEDLVHGVRVVASGESLLAPTVTRRLIADVVRSHRPRPPADDRLDTLSARERQTMELIARGMSNAEIAAELGVSEHTAKSHVSSILTKLDLRDRVHAVICAYETGLVVADR